MGTVSSSSNSNETISNTNQHTRSFSNDFNDSGTDGLNSLSTNSNEERILNNLNEERGIGAGSALEPFEFGFSSDNEDVETNSISRQSISAGSNISTVGNTDTILSNDDSNQIRRKHNSPRQSLSKVSRALSPRSLNGNDKSSPVYYCVVKAKTRHHNSNRQSRRVFYFEVKKDSSFSIGRNADCDITLDDDRCAPVNILCKSVNKSNKDEDSALGTLLLQPKARIYQLVGMGEKRVCHKTVLYNGAVIKVGSVSLEITNLCTDESYNFIQRFAVEIDNSYDNTKRKSLKHQHVTVKSDASSVDEFDKNQASFSAAESDTFASEEEKTGDNQSSTTTIDKMYSEDEKAEQEVKLQQQQLDTDNLKKKESDESEEEKDETMCYICWGGIASSPTAGAGNVSDSIKNTQNNNGNKNTSTGSSACSSIDQNTNSQQKINPLIQNPCGKCSGSSKYVHLNCLLRWIKSSGSGHCSICNGPLPQHFSSPPPSIELKVVRHRRGQSWVGTRRFRLSFAECDKITIGRLHDSDVRLSDRSVGSKHAIITFNRDLKQFELSDCSSQGGTFLQVKDSLQLSPCHEFPVYLKVGRSLLTVKIAQRKMSLLNILPGLSWSKK